MNYIRPSFFPLRITFVNNVSTFKYSSFASPFDTVMENSGVKTRSSEQTMLSHEAHILLVTDSSSEEDSQTDDQSYSPLGVCSNLAGLCCSYCAYGVLHCMLFD